MLHNLLRNTRTPLLTIARQAARERGRLGGRPPALSQEDLAAAKALLRDPAITVEQVAGRLGVAPATLYRHLPGGRSTVEARQGNGIRD